MSRQGGCEALAWTLSRTRRRILTWLWLSFALAPLMLAAAVGELVAFGLAAHALSREFGFVAGLALAGAILFVTYALALAAHEAGHALAATVAGWPVRFLHAGPLTLTRSGGGWRLGWDGRLWGEGGLVRTDPGPGRRWRVALFVAAGPAANLALAAAAVPLVAPVLPPLLRCCGGLFAVHSLVLAVLSLVPHQMRRVDSDGLALWRLLVAGRIPGARLESEKAP
jgi:hypothetical protein